MHRIIPLVWLAACEPRPLIVDCTDAEAPSVVLTLEDADGTRVTDAWIRYEVAGEASECEAWGDGTFVCGFETLGEFTLDIRADGRRPVLETVQVDQGACHVNTVERTIQLERIGDFFAEDRAYLHQIIEDEEECANSWELYGMNCHMWAIFCADGDVEIVTTDIVNAGIYGIVDEAVVTELGGGDLPEHFAFDVASEDELVDREWGFSWLRDTTGEWTSPYCD